MPLSEQGVNVDRYMFIPRTLVFVFNQDRVLLIKGAPTKRLWSNKFNGLGGHVEADESVYAAAQREIFEEAGITDVQLTLVGLISISTGQNPGIMLFVYSGQTENTNILPGIEGPLQWVKITEFQSLPLVEDLYELLPRVLSYKPEKGFLYGQYNYTQEGMLITTFTIH